MEYKLKMIWGDEYFTKEEQFKDLAEQGYNVLFTASTGHENINEELARKYGIIKEWIKGDPYSADVAQYGLLLLLSILRRFNLSLRNKRTLVIGHKGRIGSKIKTILCASNHSTLGLDLVDFSTKADFKERVKAMLPGIDIIFLCIPGGTENAEFFTTEELSLLKKAIIINISGRDELISTVNLAYASSKEYLLAYAIDKEMFWPDFYNGFVLCSPHQAAQTDIGRKNKLIEINKVLQKYNQPLLTELPKNKFKIALSFLRLPNE